MSTLLPMLSNKYKGNYLGMSNRAYAEEKAWCSRVTMIILLLENGTILHC